MLRHVRTMEKSYKTAIEILDAARRQARPNIKQTFNELQQIPSANGELQIRGTPSILGMNEWLQRIGHTPADVARLNVIHVAGTKGKGSTCAFIDSFLRAYCERTGFPSKVGLYTSPHLVCPEERIRINFAPLAQDKFVKYLLEVHDRLDRTAAIGNEGRPRYLQLLALVAFHTFVSEGVEAAIFETHHGGEFDATNVIQNPVATIVTSLGMDHVAQLGPTIENIAWHKSGIFKPGTMAFSPTQDPAAMQVLAKRAEDKSASFQVAEHDPALPADTIQLKPDVQRTNCSVALAAARAFVTKVAPRELGKLTSDDVERGIERFFWPGRFQIVSQSAGFEHTQTKTGAELTLVQDLGPYQWYLDSAHNEMSIVQAGEWFMQTSRRTSNRTGPRILLFTQLSNAREGKDVLRMLASCLRHCDIQHVVFTTYEIGAGIKTIVKEPTQDPEIPKSFAELFKEIVPSAQTTFVPTITEAVAAIQGIGSKSGGMQVLVTGSQHLVGGVLLLLKPQMFGLNTPKQLQG